MPLAIYMGMRASRLEAQPRRHYGSEGLLGSSLAGQLQRQTRKRRDAPHPLTVVSKGLPLTVSFLGTRGSPPQGASFRVSNWCKLCFSSRKCFWSRAKLPKWLLAERFAEQSFTLALQAYVGPSGPWTLQGVHTQTPLYKPRCFHAAWPGWALGPSRAHTQAAS